MKSVHFYKAHCRLGLIDIPYGSDEWNFGVEDGPDAVVTGDFLKTFPEAPVVDSFTFTNPEEIEKKSYQKTIAREYKNLAKLINSTHASGETQVVIGGDHSVTFASVIALMRRFKAVDIGYIQFDSHGDIHTFQTSPRGNFHGIYVRAFVDNVGSKMVQSIVAQKLPWANVRYYGNLVVEPEEREFLKRSKISVVSRGDFLKNKFRILNQLEAFIQNKKHIHVTFDVDIFDRRVQPATGILVEDGFFPADIWPLLKIISKAQSLSLDLVEINPKKPGIAQTLIIGRKIIKILCA